MAKTNPPEGAKWSMVQLQAIVSHGMPLTEARMLLDEGWSPEDVIALAEMQAEQRKQAATDAQQATAKAMQKAMRPENETHPGKSALSYPKGDVAQPRPVLPFELWWNAYPMHQFPETEHWRELELAAKLQPGEFTVIRKDGSKMTISVAATRNADNAITRLDATFPEMREEKALTPPKMVSLYQMVHGGTGKPPRQLFLEGMNEFYTIAFGDAVSA
jgi:hypothetical protein